MIGFNCGRVTAADSVNLRHVISHRSVRTIGYWSELYGLFHRHFNVPLLVFETGIYWDFFYGNTSGYLKIKHYENDMVTVFWIKFMIFYTKDAMSPSRCPRRPDHFFHRKILQLNTEKNYLAARITNSIMV